jgi:hypothetical protein
MPILTISDSDARNMSFLRKTDTGNLLVSVMGERDTLRKTYILSRGQYDAPAAEVVPNALPAVMPFDTTRFPRNRLGLAEWTVSRQNPLTARVFVNQLWQEFFGRGIVKSSNDFGMQGDLPSDAPLLDWLAVDFMDNHWDIKRLVKFMVLSAAYRQSAQTTPEKLDKDPDNMYLSRGPRNRLPAEFVRDLVLSSSGLLAPTIGGPSVKPYQPAGLWEAATSGRGVLATYRQDHHDSLYRRGMYTFIKLTVPPPSMGIFDASNRDQCEVRRGKTNTPLQALVMMNDPTVLEASRVLAQRLLASPATDEARLTMAFRLIVCRHPTKKELTVLTDYYKDQLGLFHNKQLNARQTLSVGEYPQASTEEPDATAALMKVIELIYNLEETITRS